MSLDFTALHFHVAYPVLAGVLAVATARIRSDWRRAKAPRQPLRPE